ncbi:hypothetical protein [Sinorhizobium meliloti]|uniref:hypothetical protein n=1 Tax=Rhizobium meliloti TaxID=382 RepID=UPI00309EFFD2
MADRIETLPRKSTEPKPKRPRATPLIRHIVVSDNHEFVGRVYDLGIIAYHFDSYEDLARHPDCKYAFHVNHTLSSLTRRVESLNLVGDMLWPERVMKDFKDFPVSRYEWLTIAADVFLMRFISIIDCALILANDVYETGLAPQKCSIDQLRRAGVPSKLLSVLEEVRTDQGDLRPERNARFHHGAERAFTDDSNTFQMAARFEQWGNGVLGHDQHGRRINVVRSFREGLVELQREFNVATRKLVRHLDAFYDLVGVEFESRFTPRIRAATHGFNAGSRAREVSKK